VIASALTLLEPHLSRTERMAAMAVTALGECLRTGQAEKAEQLPLVLSLPEPDSGAPVQEAALLQALRDAAGSVRLEVPASGLWTEGRAGFFSALAQATELLRSRRYSRVLVGAVDSMCDVSSLRHLSRKDRIQGRTQRDGIIPGEGAGFFLLTSAAALDIWGAKPRGWVVAHALAEERHHFRQEEPNLADGLTEAFRELRLHSMLGGRRVDEILSCQTGEGFWAREFQWASLRNASLMPEPLVVRLTAEAMGDAGASAGAMGVGLALHQVGRLEPAHGHIARVLVYGCSDTGRVGACVIEGET
jgi:3-oxoacyl-[acyl-carrier-protein] synthase-1